MGKVQSPMSKAQSRPVIECLGSSECVEMIGFYFILPLWTIIASVIYSVTFYTRILINNNKFVILLIIITDYKVKVLIKNGRLFK